MQDGKIEHIFGEIIAGLRGLQIKISGILRKHQDRAQAKKYQGIPRKAQKFCRAVGLRKVQNL